MLSRYRRRIRNFFRRTNTINNEPINKISLMVLILVDIFILVNVFFGLNDVGNWPISPANEFPCYASWNAYRDNDSAGKDFELLRTAISRGEAQLRVTEEYQILSAEHLGSVSDVCMQYASLQDRLNTPDNRQVIAQIDQKQITIGELETANQSLRNQYDSTLLEEIAGQPRNNSINSVAAADAKRTLDVNTAQITTLKNEITTLKNQLLEGTAGQELLAFVNNTAEFEALQQGYDRASFWHPTLEILFQGLFLLPLLAIAGSVHRFAQNRNYGLVALISWHLLVIFWVPLIVKLFQILQVGALFTFLTSIVEAILGGLLFLVSYFYIVLIPLIGFGLIKFFQKIVFNPRLQAAGRVQQGRCMRCARKLQPRDHHCPHCGYDQFMDCPACHQPTYQLLPYCHQCGAAQVQEGR